MSRALLEHLRERYAFDATPSTHDLGVYHVPFDELLGGVRVEGRLDRGVRAGERIAMVGGTGSGKSSVVAGVLGPAARGVAPILVPLMASEASAARKRAASATRQPPGDRSSERPPHPERMGLTADLLGRISRHALQPVLVFDDTDRWMAGPRRVALDGFFRPVLRAVGELPASLVVAVNRGYPAETMAHLDTKVDIPDLSATSQLVALLDRRVAAHVEGTGLAGATAADVFDDGAVTVLFQYYRRPGVYLRDVIQVAHRALAEAVDQGEAIVTEWFVQGSLPDR